MNHHIAPDGQEFFALIATYLTKADQAQVRDAFLLAREAHGQERRKSGELFFTHPLTIAYYLAEYSLDAPTLIAALLHDVVEDTRVSIAEIEAQFGQEVARLVEGLTKFEAATSDPIVPKLTSEDLRNATLRKLFGFMTNDLRVGIIKIFDRLHNMRTIFATSPASQRRKAEETLNVYAPLANRLGIWNVKNELEAISLSILDGRAYEAIHQQLQQQAHQQQPTCSAISRELAAHLTKAGIQIADIKPQPENVYTVYRASAGNGHRAYKLDDTPRLVVLLKNIDSCYQALGRTHQLWRPVPHTFDDYIAAPRDNLYQSLHTTVNYRQGQRLRIRFRTITMNTLSEIGVLAKWLTVGNPLWSPEIDMPEIDRHVGLLLNNIIENINLESHDPGVGVQGVVDDVFGSQIAVFTPRGDIKQLPVGATALDFAYTIHTEVGAQCRAAIVNGQPYPLNKPLQDGDQIQIVKRGNAPQRVWLDENLGYLTMSTAVSQARRWFRRLPPEVAIKEGKQLLNSELRMLGLTHLAHDVIADLFGFHHSDDLYHALGRAELLPTVLATQVLVDRWNQGPLRQVGVPVRSEDGDRFVITNAADRAVRLCLTCHPRPGDAIVGFARSSTALTVHKENCHNLPPDPFGDRTLKLGWGGEDARQVRLINVHIDVFDRSGLLFEITDLIRSENINMPEVHAQSKGGEATISLAMEVASGRQLVRVLHRIHALTNVYSVRCLNMP